nr:hypothetical protein [Rhodoplanes sp. Z2-YC6860]
MLLLDIHHVQKDFDSRILMLEFADEFLHQSGPDHRGHEPDLDAADLAACCLAGDGHRLLGFAQDIPGAVQHAKAGFGQFDMGVAAPLYELGAELLLELLDLLRERRRTDSEIHRRAAEVLLFGKPHEIAKQPRFDLSHVGPPSNKAPREPECVGTDGSSR